MVKTKLGSACAYDKGLAGRAPGSPPTFVATCAFICDSAESYEAAMQEHRAAILARTSMPVSDYYGSNGIQFRNDLAGLNLTTVPKVLIESGNMVNATDAALLTSPRFQRHLAAALLAAIRTFLGM